MVDLDTRDQLLRLNLRFWELSDVVTHRRVVPQVDLGDKEDEAMISFTFTRLKVTWLRIG